jgi:hypothetical protein
MPASFDRRSFLGLAPAVISWSRCVSAAPNDSSPASFLYQDRELVREVVAAAHGDVKRVRDLVTARPALARASWDWGFGDHEAAIDAASHVGNRTIAEFLVANGARPTIFTAAMLGQLQVVRGMIEALPGVQRWRGPHGITLLAHARAGGTAAAEVLEYLERLGDADPAYQNLPIRAAEEAALTGDYELGSGFGGRLVVETNKRGDLTIAMPGVMIARTLFHQGGLVFIPAGVEAASLRFEVGEGGTVTLAVTDGPVVVSARKTPRAIPGARGHAGVMDAGAITGTPR